MYYYVSQKINDIFYDKKRKNIVSNQSQQEKNDIYNKIKLHKEINNEKELKQKINSFKKELDSKIIFINDFCDTKNELKLDKISDNLDAIIKTDNNTMNKNVIINDMLNEIMNYFINKYGEKDCFIDE
jgi:ABC-type phosphate transport system auxiliary subunit